MVALNVWPESWIKYKSNPDCSDPESLWGIIVSTIFNNHPVFGGPDLYLSKPKS